MYVHSDCVCVSVRIVALVCINNEIIVKCIRFFDDGKTPSLRKSHPRHYAFLPGTTSVNGKRWAVFLQWWTCARLGSATRMLDADVVGDLSPYDKMLYRQLREFTDVLLLKQTDPLHMFQTRLRSMHNLGMLNLSLATIDENDKVHQLRVKYRSSVCRLREANKRTQAATERARRAENEKSKMQKLLKVAIGQVAAFRSDYPEWVPPEKMLLPKPQDEEFRVLFEV